jgi:hypothetical protein
MIQRLEHQFDLPPRAVKQRRKKIQRNERNAVNTETDYFPGIAEPRGVHNQDDKSRCREARPDQMRNAVYPFTVAHMLSDPDYNIIARVRK